MSRCRGDAFGCESSDFSGDLAPNASPLQIFDRTVQQLSDLFAPRHYPTANASAKNLSQWTFKIFLLLKNQPYLLGGVGGWLAGILG